MKKIYEGFDNLDAAVNGILSLRTIDYMRHVKEELKQDEHKETLVFEINGEEFKMFPTGGEGGYEFHVEHDIGHFWIKGRQLDWPVRFSVGSEGFVKCGSLDNVEKAVKRVISCFCYSVETINASRVDYAIDFILDKDFSFDPFKFTVKSIRGYNPFYSDNGELESDFHIAKRELTGVRFGKMPNRQLVIYDKTREIKKSHKDYWLEIWGASPDFYQGAKVWRVECRAGKNILKKFLGSKRGFDELRDKIRSILCATFDLIKYRKYSESEVTDTNFSRVAVHEVWNDIKAAFNNMQERVLALKEISAVRESITETLRVQVEKQAIGTLITAAYMSDAKDYEAVIGYLDKVKTMVQGQGEYGISNRLEAVRNRYLENDVFLDAA